VYGSRLPTQNGYELFYRLQVTKEFAVTPDIQYLRNPALNPDESSIWVFGLRLRLSL
jgi:porin